jgi:hypothetical protein
MFKCLFELIYLVLETAYNQNLPGNVFYFQKEKIKSKIAFTSIQNLSCHCYVILSGNFFYI